MSSSDIETIRETLLLLRVQTRDEGAFQELVTHYERRLLYYIHRILGNGADRSDVLQEIWLRVFLKIHTVRVPSAFRVWLYKIAHDVAVSHLRKVRRWEAVSLRNEDAVEVPESSDWNELKLLEHAEQVHAALSYLSIAHREVLTLRFLEELELSEIAEVIGCSVGTVKSRLHYAKSEMRKLLEGDAHD
ncbi:MAG TPA: sigma-70 family RNA polymerase sigma factor [Planctomycetaceae bacterium]|nr:sigma-70 family RNA polymerase sigma factor [Planctomycetaceae bacterium]